MTSVQKRLIKLYPEKEQRDELESVLLRTIRLPKNLLYLTEQLPSATYDDRQQQEKTESLPEPQKKTNRTIDLAVDRGKRFQKVKRGSNRRGSNLNLNRSEIV